MSTRGVRWGRWRLLAVAIASAAVAVGVVAVGAAGARSRARTPLPIASTTLVQQGPQLVWTVSSSHRFARAALSRSGRALCLTVESLRSRTVTELCLGARRGGRTPVLRDESHGSRGAPVPATFTRSGAGMVAVSFPVSAVESGYGRVRWQVTSAAAPRGCRRACIITSPAKPAVLALHEPRLVGCVSSGAPYVTNGPRTQPVVALTFDDGPWYDTAQFLDILEREHVPATFFQIGEHIRPFDGAVLDQRMLADGDMIGDHTWSHIDVAGAGRLAAQQLIRARDAITAASGFTPCLFRAPGGATSPALIAEARRLGFTTIQWDVDPRDWTRPGTRAIYTNVVDNARNGSIILQHDGGGDRSETLAALPREIARLKARGFGFVTVTQLLGFKLIWR